MMNTNLHTVPSQKWDRDTFPHSVLNVEVSCFKDVFTASDPVKINLLSWLASTKYRGRQEELRRIGNKAERDALKCTLPGITPSGVFSYRMESKLVKHSSLIQFDIDPKGNEGIMNYHELKAHIQNIKNVAYCGLSASGNGFWGLIPIAYPELHKPHFAFIERKFMEFGITIDTKPKNVASLRGYAYDPEGYFNHAPTILEKYDEEQRETVKVYNRPISTDPMENEIKVELCLSEIKDKSLDITAGYDVWFEIGCSLANAFGERGRGYFHEVSQFNQAYKSNTTDRQYSYCLGKSYRYTLGTFFYHCKQNGVYVVPHHKPGKHIIRPPGRPPYLLTITPDLLPEGW